MFNFQEGRLDQVKAATCTNAIGGLSHIFVCFGATTAVADDEDTIDVVDEERDDLKRFLQKVFERRCRRDLATAARR